MVRPELADLAEANKRIRALEEMLAAREAACGSYRRELDALKASMVLSEGDRLSRVIGEPTDTLFDTLIGQIRIERARLLLENHDLRRQVAELVAQLPVVVIEVERPDAEGDN